MDRPGPVRQGGARQGTAAQERSGQARQGTVGTRQGLAGTQRLGLARQCVAGLGRTGKVGTGGTRLGPARTGRNDFMQSTIEVEGIEVGTTALFCEWGGNHEELVALARRDRQRLGHDVDNSYALCMKCRRAVLLKKI